MAELERGETMRRDVHVDPNATAQGWGIAALVVLLAIVCAALAFWYHKQHYRDPLDTSAVSWVTAKSAGALA